MKSYQQAMFDIITRIDDTIIQVGEDYPTLGDNTTGKWKSSPEPGWIGSFWIGLLWYAYQKTGALKYRNLAETLCGKLSGKQPLQNHDTGFLNYYSFKYAYDITQEERWKTEALAAADRLLELYNPKTELIAAWNNNGDDTIIDTMMNLPILWWAYQQTNKTAYRDIAINHAIKTRAWFVRPDGSTYQSVHYNPKTGELGSIHTHQGYQDQSVWSRGQSWAIYGFALAYRETKDTRFLETADLLASYILAHLPEDMVPWYDYDDPGIKYHCRDTSAGAITANGFLVYSDCHPETEKRELYRKTGIMMVNNLIDHYLTPINANDTTPPGILQHGCNLRPLDEELIWGDYYLAEALVWLLAQNIIREPSGK